MQIREATPEDREAIYRVHQASIEELGPRGYDEAQVAAWGAGGGPGDYDVDSDTNHFVVAESDGDVVGFGEFDADTGEYLTTGPEAEVKAVYVDPGVAREGVGSALLAELKATARERGHESFGLCSSLNAVGFYDRHGYSRVGEQPHEFSGGVEGTVMEMYIDL